MCTEERNLAYQFFLWVLKHLAFSLSHINLQKVSKVVQLPNLQAKGPFKYYVIKKVGGWVRPNAYVCLQGEWVGLAKRLRNSKNHQKWIFQEFKRPKIRRLPYI